MDALVDRWTWAGIVVMGELLVKILRFLSVQSLIFLGKLRFESNRLDLKTDPAILDFFHLGNLLGIFVFEVCHKSILVVAFPDKAVFHFLGAVLFAKISLSQFSKLREYFFKLVGFYSAVKKGHEHFFGPKQVGLLLSLHVIGLRSIFLS